MDKSVRNVQNHFVLVYILWGVGIRVSKVVPLVLIKFLFVVEDGVQAVKSTLRSSNIIFFIINLSDNK